MKLYDIIGNRVDIHPDLLGLPYFKQLYDKDRELAYRQISYIVLKNAYDTPYKSLDLPTRDKTLRREFFKDNWEPNEDVLKAERQFVEIYNNSLENKLLDGTENTLWDLYEYFNKRRDEALDDNLANKALANLSKVGPAMQSLNALRQAVASKQFTKSRIRGDAEINSYEIPHK